MVSGHAHVHILLCVVTATLRPRKKSQPLFSTRGCDFFLGLFLHSLTAVYITVGGRVDKSMNTLSSIVDGLVRTRKESLSKLSRAVGPSRRFVRQRRSIPTCSARHSCVHAHSRGTRRAPIAGASITGSRELSHVTRECKTVVAGQEFCPG